MRLYGWAQPNHMVLKSEDPSWLTRKSEENMTVEEWTQRNNVTRLQVRGSESHEPRNVSSLQKLENESKQIFS